MQGELRQIASTWADVSVAKMHTSPNTPREVIRHFSNITEDECKALTSDQVLALMAILEFLEDEPANIKIKEVVDVAGGSWGKCERTKIAITQRNPWSMSVEVCVIYFGNNALKWSVGQIYGQSKQIINSLSVFLERYKDLNDSKGYTENEINAGVKDLETFGVGAVRYSLANGDLTKYKAIEETDAETVYFTLMYSKAVAMYQERLNEENKMSNTYEHS